MPERIDRGIARVGVLRESPGQQHFGADRYRKTPEVGQDAARDRDLLDPRRIGGRWDWRNRFAERERHRGCVRRIKSRVLRLAEQVSRESRRLDARVAEWHPDRMAVRPLCLRVAYEQCLDLLVG